MATVDPFLALVGTTIKQERKQNSLTIKEMASIMGLSEQTIICIERGTRGTGLENYKKMASVLGVTLDELTDTRSLTLSSASNFKKNKKAALEAMCRGLNEDQAELVMNFINQILGYSKNTSDKNEEQ